MMDYTPISDEETDIFGRFAVRASRADNVATEDARTFATSF
jgi:hypothetical protein